MNSPGGHPEHDPGRGSQVDPMTGQPLHGQRPPHAHGAGGPPGGGYHPNSPYPPPGGPPPAEKKGMAGLVALLVGIVVLISAAGTGMYFWLAEPIQPKAMPQPQAVPPPMSSAPSGSAPSSGTSSVPRTTETSAPDVDAAIPGWQPIADPRTSTAYDVPPGWKVESSGTLVGFEDESGPRTIMHAVATYKDEACAAVDGSYRGHTGIMGDPLKDVDPRKAAEVGARLWATAAAEVAKDDPSVPRPRAEPITLSGGLKAWKAISTIAPPAGDCAAPEMKVTTVSFELPSGEGSVLFVMYADQGVPDALPADKAEKVISTLRPID